MPKQLQRIEFLCAETGERYYTPRTRRQALGRIRDLQILQARGKKQPAPTPRERVTQDEFMTLLRRLKRLHYGERHNEAADLERRIDRMVESM